MSARVVAVTQLLLDVLDDLGPQVAGQLKASEADLSLLVWPWRPELIQINNTARAEMAAEVIKMLDT